MGSMRTRETDIDLDRAFLVAHLLTGNVQDAEAAVLLAMESWKPENESGEYLFRKIVQAAAGSRIERTSFASTYHLPSQLQNVLKLSRSLRRSFVLRMLVGLPAEVCADLLSIDSQLVDEHLRCALLRLGDCALDRRE